MAWGDVLAALAGAGEGELGREERDTQRKHQLALAEGKGVVAQVIQELKNRGALDTAALRDTGATTRTNATNQTRRDIASDQTDLGWGRLASQDSIAGMRDDTTRRGQDLTEGRFWGGTLPEQYYGVDTTDATRRRGQDVAAGASKYRADTAAGSTDRRTNALAGETRVRDRAKNVLSVLGLKAKQKPNIFGASADPTNWADEFDRLYNDPDALAGEAIRGTPDASTPASMTPPGASPAAAPPATPAKPPSGLTVGAMVRLKNGKTVTVTKVNPDGTFEYK